MKQSGNSNIVDTADFCSIVTKWKFQAENPAFSLNCIQLYVFLWINHQEKDKKENSSVVCLDKFPCYVKIQNKKFS